MRLTMHGETVFLPDEIGRNYLRCSGRPAENTGDQLKRGDWPEALNTHGRIETPPCNPNGT
jgi:hypothetical protein